MRTVIFLLLFISLLQSKEFYVSTSSQLYLALKSAENNSQDDVILLRKGTYTSSEREPFEYISSEEYDITLQADGNGTNGDVVISGAGKLNGFSVKNEDHSITVTVMNLSFQNCQSKSKGGAILIENIGELNLERVKIADSEAQHDGGGVYTDGTVILNNSTLLRNSSKKGRGGGVFAGRNAIVKDSDLLFNSSYKHGGGLYSVKTALVKDSEVSHNSASYGGGAFSLTKLKTKGSRFTYNSAKYEGGGIRSEKVRVINSNISHNKSIYGGGIYTLKADLDNTIIDSCSAKFGGGIYSRTIKLEKSSITKNRAEHSGGGLKGDKIIVRNSKLHDNSAEKEGGAIESGHIIMANSEALRNSANSGGAIHSKNTTVTNSVISNNKASYRGGGVKSYKVKLRYTTLCNNRSEDSGGGVFGVEITVTNSNLSRNISPKGGGVYGSHTSKIIITNSFFFQNQAYYGGAISGSVKIYNSLLLNNYGTGMTLYGKGTLVNNIVRNITAPDLESKEVMMSGELKVYNNYINLSNIYNYQFYKLLKNNNKELEAIEDDSDLSFLFGKNSRLSYIGLYPNSRQSCKEIFDTDAEYNRIIRKTGEMGDNIKGADFEVRGDDSEDSYSYTDSKNLLADISDLVIEGDQKVYSELYFVIIVRKGKYPVMRYSIDFGDGNGFKQLQNSSTRFRYHNSGEKKIKVKIIDKAGNIITKNFSVEIDELTQEEFKEILKDEKTREYLEKISKGFLKVADNPIGSKYNLAIDSMYTGDMEIDDKEDSELKRQYSKLLAELNDDRIVRTDDFNISKMLQFNNSVNEIKDYILQNLDKFDLVTKQSSRQGIERVKSYILSNPGEFNLTKFKNYEEIVVDIQETILNNLDEYNLTEKQNIDKAFHKGQETVLNNLEAFNLMKLKDFQDRLKSEMEKLTRLIQANPAKYGIKITKGVLDNLKGGWTLLGTIDKIDDMSLFKSFTIVWIFVDGEFKGYSPNRKIRRQIVHSGFKLFDHIPKNAGIWLNK